MSRVGPVTAPRFDGHTTIRDGQMVRCILPVNGLEYRGEYRVRRVRPRELLGWFDILDLVGGDPHGYLAGRFEPAD